jgi:murein L,D-transpeptidase YcbB/YkuD
MRMTRPSCFRASLFLLSFIASGHLQQGGRFGFPSRIPVVMVNLATDAQGPSGSGEALMRACIRAGRLADLRWPDFTDYHEQVNKFYESGAYTLAWTRNSRPTPQALAMAGLFRDAAAKGLPAEDYDGPWWQDHISKLVHTSGAALVRFDLALTVSAMRYLSDLNVGRANPRHLTFQVDDDHEKYDLARFLRQQVVSARNVGAVVSQVEPPYEGYRRTVGALHAYRELARESEIGPFVHSKKPIKPGDGYADLRRLALFLQHVGDLPANPVVPLSSTQYQGPLWKR